MRNPGLKPEQQIVKVDDLVRIAGESFKCCPNDQSNPDILARTFVALLCGTIESMYGVKRGNEFARALGFEHLIDNNNPEEGDQNEEPAQE